MQNNITEITQKLLGALDGNYNVTNMATIIEVITLLEKVTITKEMLETTRLGKHINELRKHISNETLAKRAKLLVKKWRNIVLVANPPENVLLNATATTNGQVRPVHPVHAVVVEESKKRPPPKLEPPIIKKHRPNGVPTAFDYDFSDNSNSSFKDVPIVPNKPVVVVNSDSNSSMPDVKNEPLYEEQQPKKRGRKKGSKNHKNLIEEAESSFSNKMAVSRGNAKVKTTQELIESLQNRSHVGNACPTPAAPLTSPAKNIEDWRERAAKLTERVSLIDQKLNSGNRVKKRNNNKDHTTPPLKSFSDTTPEPTSRPDSPEDDEDEIVVVDDLPSKMKHHLDEQGFSSYESQSNAALIDGQLLHENVHYIPSLSIEEALSRLPPIDSSSMYADCKDDDDGQCLCVLEEIEDEVVELKFRIDDNCPARVKLNEKYRLNDVDDVDGKVDQLHTTCIDNLNGNYGSSIFTPQFQSKTDGNRDNIDERVDFPLNNEMSRVQCIAGDNSVDDGCRNLNDVNIVPNFYELPAKRDAACSENYKKYSISEYDARNAPRGLGHDDYDNNSNSNHSSCKDKQDIKDVLIDRDSTEKKTNDALIFREFHECLDRPSYNGDMLRILPYVVID